MSNFWDSLQKPIVALAPMDGVTDHSFRHIQKKYGNTPVVYTEFTSVEGVCRGATRLLKDFLYDATQRPIIAQIYGTTPDFFRQTAIILCQLGFDGVDINMGCPAKNVAHSGAGAALIKTPQLAQEIVRATQRGVLDWREGASARDCSNITDEIRDRVEERAQLLSEQYASRSREIPVSVKTRIGYHTPVVSDWIPTLLETNPAVIAIHGRTLKQQYAGAADWSHIGAAVTLAEDSDTLVFGNGDVKNYEQALKKVREYGVDGVLIGRGAFGNPYIYQRKYDQKKSVFKIALEHAQLFEATNDKTYRNYFLPMRKHLGWYVRSVPNATKIRVELFKTNSALEVQQVLEKHNLL